MNLHNEIINALSFFIPIKEYKEKFKYKYTRMRCSKKLENKVVFLELPTIKDARNHLAHHFSDVDFEFVDAFDKEAVKKARKNAKILISEGACPKKYINQIAIEIWHASGFIKNACNLKQPNRTFLDWVVCPSEGVVDTYATAFGVSKDKVLTFGSIKNDYCFNKSKCKQIKNSFFNKHPYLKGKKIYSWAPTFRGDWKKDPHLYSVINLDKLDELLLDDEVVLLRLHPSLKYFNSTDDLRTNLIPKSTHKKIIDFSSEPLNEMTLVSDVFISDYSSCILDAMVADVSVMFFAEDLDDYIANRGTPFDYRKDVPNLLEKCSEEEFVKFIRTIKKDTKKYNSFKKKWLGSCGGKAGERIYNFVKSKMKEEL
ncbi:MAG: CDP-glycerol glycerophosphotransferase family protein [Alphaproteobacteria bacterium]